MNGISKTILLVEDEALISIAQRVTLEKIGYHVITADSGENALDIFRMNDAIDLILMDIDLGTGLNGPDTAKIILDIREIPVVFLSSHTDPEIVRMTEEITSYGYVVKNTGITVLDASMKMAFKLFNAKKNEEAKELALRKSDQRIRAKLEAVLKPEGDISAVELSDIFDIEPIQSIINDLYKVNGIGCAILDLKGNVLAEIGWQDICTLFHREHPVTCGYCLESDTELSSGVKQGEFKINKCKNGMWDMATPVYVGGSHLGNIFLGQFFFEDEEPDYEIFRARAREFGFDEKEYIAALDRVPRWSREKVNSIMSLYSKFAGRVAMLGYSNVRLARILDEQEKYREMLDNAPGSITVYDYNGNYLYANSNTFIMHGYTEHGHEEKEFMNSSLREIDFPERDGIFSERMKLVEETGETVFEAYQHKKDGSVFPVEVTAKKVMWGAIPAVLSIATDITIRKQAEEAVRNAGNLYRNIFLNSQIGLFRADYKTGIVIEANDAFAVFAGYQDRNFLLADKFNIVDRYIDPSERFVMIDLIRTRGELKNSEARFRRNDGSVIWIRLSVRYVRDQGYLEGVAEDITERKIAGDRLRESEEQYRLLFENSPLGIYIADRDGNILDANERLLNILGSPSIEATKKINVLGLPALVNNGYSDKFRECVDLNKITTLEFVYTSQWGKTTFASNYIVPVADASGNVVKVFTLLEDITGRKKAEEKIKAMLREKEMFLKEVHHRVKNNMNTVSGILYLQADEQSDPATEAILIDSASRVQSMMVLYDKLYQSEGHDELNIGQYLPALIEEILNLFKHSVHVKTDIRVEDFFISAKILSSIGIIINEFITNSMKYAFNESKSGVIEVTVRRRENLVSIIYRDSGSGLPENITFENSTGFGMQLISMLTEQIGGTISVERGGGTKFILEFALI